MHLTKQKACDLTRRTCSFSGTGGQNPREQPRDRPSEGGLHKPPHHPRESDEVSQSRNSRVTKALHEDERGQGPGGLEVERGRLQEPPVAELEHLHGALGEEDECGTGHCGGCRTKEKGGGW